MILSEEMFAVFERSIADYHQWDRVDAQEQNPYESSSLEYILYSKNWIDTVQWHLEDIIRDPAIQPEKALEIKRRIDASNQDRTDMVEQLDENLLSHFQDQMNNDNLPLNTESPGWAVDRLSILALKIYPMRIEASRKDTESGRKAQNQHKLQVLEVQKSDLLLSVNQLFSDLKEGKRRVKVYRQMKMYNDPELNPVLYAKKD